MTAKHEKSWEKVMITKDHLSAQLARGTPGPGSYHALQLASQARVRFGTSKRRGLSDNGFKAPGPVYDVLEEAGDQQKVNVRIGREGRFKTFDEGVPGPGNYPRKEDGSSPCDATTGFNGGKLSKSFGASHRSYDKVFFPGCEREKRCRMSPGPGTLKPFDNAGFGRTFGGAPRMPPNLAAKRAPGPGAYDNHERETAVFSSSSSWSMGRPQARGRLDLKQMKILTHSSTWGITG
jgi:hypothetical protein